MNLSTVALIAFCSMCTSILQVDGSSSGVSAAACVNRTVTAATQAVVEAAGTRIARWLVPRITAMALSYVSSDSNA